MKKKILIILVSVFSAFFIFSFNSKAQIINGSEFPNYYEWAVDNDFSGTSNGNFKYIGSKDYVIVPKVIKGVEITSIEDMFYRSPVKGVVLEDGSKITNMRGAFEKQTSYTLELDYFGDTSNVINMSSMFDGAQATSLNLSSFDTSNVSSMGYMFDSAKATYIDISNFTHEKVSNKAFMFVRVENITVVFKNQEELDYFTTDTRFSSTNKALTEVDKLKEEIKQLEFEIEGLNSQIMILENDNFEKDNEIKYLYTQIKQYEDLIDELQEIIKELEKTFSTVYLSSYLFNIYNEEYEIHQVGLKVPEKAIYNFLEFKTYDNKFVKYIFSFNRQVEFQFEAFKTNNNIIHEKGYSDLIEVEYKNDSVYFRMYELGSLIFEVDLNTLTKVDLFYFSNYEKDYNNGFIAGLETGKAEGIEEGYSKGREDGYTIGSKEGEEKGYQKGLKEGLEDKYTLLTFVPSILGSFFMFFYQIGTISILGISILDILSVMFAIGLSIFLIRIVFK